MIDYFFKTYYLFKFNNIFKFQYLNRNTIKGLFQKFWHFLFIGISIKKINTLFSQKY